MTEHNELQVMRYLDGEMEPVERDAFEQHLAGCASCRELYNELHELREVTDSMKIADLPETVWDKYWTVVYNRIERSVAWFLFILGASILSVYWLYRVITDPSIRNIVGFGTLLMVIGLAVLFLSVFREKAAVNKSDRYISEIKR